MTEAGPDGPGFCRAYAALADRWLAELLGDEGDVALVAVGGYGRGELAPESDLDVVLLHRGRRDIKAVADRVWYPVWDANVRLDHSVRTVKEALAVADADLKAALGLLDARLVAGDEKLAADLARRAVDLWRKRARRWLPVLAGQVAERHARFGEVAFLLEPDLKEGAGGLRDRNAVAAAATAMPVVPPPDRAVDDAYDTLVSARVALQTHTGRPTDRLGLEDQDAVAAALSYADADALMAAVATAGRAMAWYCDDAWARVESALSGPRGRSAARDRPLGPGLLLRDREVVLAPDASPATDSSLSLRAAGAAADVGVPLARAALDRLAAEGSAPPDPWPAETRDALVGLLGTGPAAIPLLEALDQKGLLARLLPEWAPVRSRPQRNAYHRYTVDRHLCEAAAGAALLTRRVRRPDLLLVGAWLHDIGKGYPGDHTEAGVGLVEQVATRMGFDRDDVAALVAMVRHHLLLPDVATRRDLADPRTAAMVAEAVGDRDTLQLLWALTEADSLATGPAAWSDWKAGLVEELVARATELLEGRPLSLPPAFPTDAQRALAREGEVAMARDADGGVTVVAPDRPGLFASVAGVLALHGLDVRAAAVASEGPMAIEQFDVVPALGEPPDWDRLEADLDRALSGDLAIDAALQERVRRYAMRPRSAAARAAEPRVLFDDGASDTATVVEVRAPDAIGVLYRITRALAGCGLDIRSARVSTLGHEVVDAFYVTDAGGGLVADPSQRARVEQAILAEIGR